MQSPQWSVPDGAPTDWQAIEASPEFQELVHKRRSFVLPATAFFLTWYLGFILLAGYAPEFMGERIYEGLTVGYCLALTQFAMVWILGIKYLRKADSEFEPLEQAAVDYAERIQAHDTEAPKSFTVDPFAVDGIEIPYQYGDADETARIVVEGDHVLVYADEQGTPARFDRAAFMSALGAGSPAGNGKFTEIAGGR